MQYEIDFDSAIKLLIFVYVPGLIGFPIWWGRVDNGRGGFLGGKDGFR